MQRQQRRPDLGRGRGAHRPLALVLARGQSLRNMFLQPVKDWLISFFYRPPNRGLHILLPRNIGISIMHFIETFGWLIFKIVYMGDCTIKGRAHVAAVWNAENIINQLVRIVVPLKFNWEKSHKSADTNVITLTICTRKAMKVTLQIGSAGSFLSFRGRTSWTEVEQSFPPPDVNTWGQFFIGIFFFFSSTVKAVPFIACKFANYHFYAIFTVFSFLNSSNNTPFFVQSPSYEFSYVRMWNMFCAKNMHLRQKCHQISFKGQ